MALEPSLLIARLSSVGGRTVLTVALQGFTLKCQILVDDYPRYIREDDEFMGSLYYQLEDLAALCTRLATDEPFERAEINNTLPELMRYRDATRFRVALLTVLGSCYIYAQKNRYRSGVVEQWLLVYQYRSGEPVANTYTLEASGDEFRAFAVEVLKILCLHEDTGEEVRP